jgi:acetylornithine deacetylase/succinyl-diaminopimelate desuccinylase-like protein
MLDTLRDLVRLPTVSADPRCRRALESGALYVADLVRSVGVPDVAVVRTGGRPAVVGRWPNPGRRKVLVYGHYDVQPPGPRHTWKHPPFSGHVDGTWLFGRGASDDKGQFLVHLAALDAWRRASGAPPIGVVVLLDGEEEVGSPHLGPILDAAARGVDAAVMSDMTMPAPSQPALTRSLRGALSLEVTLSTGGAETHSGLFGGAVADAAAILCRLVAGLHDTEGRVAVPGFYGQVCAIDPVERARAARDAPSDRAIAAAAGGAALAGERGWSAHERTTIRPSLAVSTATAGYQGPGVKAVVPARAKAVLNLRLVPDQEPAAIARLVAAHLQGRAPEGVYVAVRPTVGARPAVFDLRHWGATTFARALAETFGRPPLAMRSGGTIPVASRLADLGVPTVLAGFGLPVNRVHAPNERVHLPTLFRGVDAVVRWLGLVGGP